MSTTPAPTTSHAMRTSTARGRRRRMLLALALILSLASAACGGDEEVGSTDAAGTTDAADSSGESGDTTGDTTGETAGGDGAGLDPATLDVESTCTPLDGQEVAGFGALQLDANVSNAGEGRVFCQYFNSDFNALSLAILSSADPDNDLAAFSGAAHDGIGTSAQVNDTGELRVAYGGSGILITAIAATGESTDEGLLVSDPAAAQAAVEVLQDELGLQ